MSLRSSTLKKVTDPWLLEAKCRDYSDPDLFFPEHGDFMTAALAKAFCQDCPVKNECREMALRNHEQHGIWGGTTLKQRLRILRERKYIAMGFDVA